jgi:hypothetical protein
LSWNNEYDEEQKPRYWLYGMLLILALASAYVWWPRWKIYPEVTSRESLQLMKLLYSACNTKDPKRLNQVEINLKKLISQGKVNETEQAAYAQIIEQAKAGEWKSAEAASFRFAEDQVR